MLSLLRYQVSKTWQILFICENCCLYLDIDCPEHGKYCLYVKHVAFIQILIVQNMANIICLKDILFLGAELLYDSLPSVCTKLGEQLK